MKGINKHRYEYIYIIQTISKREQTLVSARQFSYQPDTVGELPVEQARNKCNTITLGYDYTIQAVVMCRRHVQKILAGSHTHCQTGVKLDKPHRHRYFAHAHARTHRPTHTHTLHTLHRIGIDILHPPPPPPHTHTHTHTHRTTPPPHTHTHIYTRARTRNTHTPHTPTLPTTHTHTRSLLWGTEEGKGVTDVAGFIPSP